MRRLEVFALLVLVLLIHRDVVFGGRAFFDRDLEHFLYERLFAFREAVLSRSLPLWNPYPAFGEPMLAVGNAEFAYPTTWLVLALPPYRTDTVVVVLHMFLASLGARALALELGLSHAGAFFAGALWGACGPLQSCTNLPNVRVGVSLMPWAWLAFARAGRSGRARDALVGALALAATLLAGAPETTIMAAAGAPLAYLPEAPIPHRVRLRRLLEAVAIALGVGVGLSALQWLPTFVVMRSSARSLFPPEAMGAWSNHPAALAQLVLPLPFEELPLTLQVRAALFDGHEPLLPSIYMGLAGTALAAIALLGPARRGRAFLAAVTLGALWLSLGRHAWLWQIGQALPPLSWIRFPTRFTILGALPLVVLAGAGVDALLGPRQSGAARWRLAGLAVSGLAVFVATLARPEAMLWRRILIAPQEFGPWSASPTIMGTLRGMALASLLAIPLAVALFARALGPVGRAGSGRLAALAGGAALLDVVLAANGINPTVRPALLMQPPPALTLVPRERPNRTFVVPYLRSVAPRLIGRDSAEHHAYDAAPELRLWIGRYYPLDSLGTPGWRIESVPPDVTGLRDIAVTRWIASLGALVDTPAFPRLVELSGIQYVLALHDLGAPDRFEPISLSQGLFAPVRTYRVLHALPRAFATAGVRIARGQDAFDALLDPAFDPLREVVLPEGRVRPPSSGGSVRIKRLGFDAVSLEADMERPGHVVLLEANCPGWRATVDGVPVPIESANLIFRAVAVPVGRHAIEMRYRPPAVLIGTTVSLVTLLAVAAFWIIRARTRRAGEPDP